MKLFAKKENGKKILVETTGYVGNATVVYGVVDKKAYFLNKGKLTECELVPV